jgi:hypothetical protein
MFLDATHRPNPTALSDAMESIDIATELLLVMCRSVIGL